MNPLSLDFNLLVPLQALLELQHVTRAAERVHLSQSAMSATLGRLRRHFDDELLVRSHNRYTLTPLGRQLLPLVNAAVKGAEEALGARAGFDPQTSSRQFVVTSSAYAAGVVGPVLRPYLAVHAPAVSVQFHTMPKHALVERHVLESDALIGPTGYALPGLYRPVFEDDFVCLLDANHPASGQAHLTVTDLHQSPLAAARFAPNLFTAADRLLEHLGVQPHAAVTAEDWLPLPWLVRHTDLIALLPRRLASWSARGGDLVVREVPGDDSAPFVEGVFHHSDRGGDEGLQWLVEAIVRSMRLS